MASSSRIIGAFLRIALAMDILCFSPPDNLTPFSPIIVSYFSGNLSTKSCVAENLLASSIFSFDALESA